MIKLTLREAMAASQALAVLPKINSRASYDLARIRDKLKSALKPVDEQRRALVEEHGGKAQDDGGVKWDTPEGSQAADKAFAELLEHEIEIEREPVKLSAINIGTDPTKWPDIQPELFSILEKIIVE